MVELRIHSQRKVNLTLLLQKIITPTIHLQERKNLHKKKLRFLLSRTKAKSLNPNPASTSDSEIERRTMRQKTMEDIWQGLKRSSNPKNRISIIHTLHQTISQRNKNQKSLITLIILTLSSSQTQMFQYAVSKVQWKKQKCNHLGQNKKLTFMSKHNSHKVLTSLSRILHHRKTTTTSLQTPTETTRKSPT